MAVLHDQRVCRGPPGQPAAGGAPSGRAQEQPDDPAGYHRVVSFFFIKWVPQTQICVSLIWYEND